MDDHLASFDILGLEENVVAGDKVARWASDLQDLVPNTAGKMYFEEDLESFPMFCVMRQKIQVISIIKNKARILKFCLT